ncbi:hypothetical protein J6590_038313 [Homalodisca vitripennis]|nr:hypothetical protein J6590_038313 [Homalodisca vitripennis]
MKLPVYLDYAATTPVDPRVANKMMQYLTMDGIFGNPASRSHRYGWLAEEAVDVARHEIADLIGADIREIIFTSGATESDNLAIKGAVQANKQKGTLPVHQIVGMGEAYRIAKEEMGAEMFRIRKLRDRLWQGLQHIKVLVLESPDAIRRNRDIIGATNPVDAIAGTLRADYADSLIENAVHGSDSLTAAMREINYFFLAGEVYGSMYQ